MDRSRRLRWAASRPAAGCLCPPGPLDGFGSWSGPRTLRRRGYIDDHSDAIRLPNPRRALPALLTPGLCRRSPAGGDRWHRPQPVPAARFTAVLPRGSGGSHRRSPPEPAGGREHSGRIGVRGPEASGVVAGNRGVRSGRWRCRSGARSPTARDPSASLPGPLRHGRSGPGLSGPRHAHRPALPEPAAAGWLPSGRGLG
jgi:hypothetical protein